MQIPGSPAHVKPRAKKSAGKLCWHFFFLNFCDAHGVLLKGYLPVETQLMDINGHYRADCLIKLWTFVTRKWGISRTHNRPLLQSNVASHKARLVQARANDFNIVIVPHPPYSPHFAPSDIFYSQLFKKTVKRKSFQQLWRCDNGRWWLF